MYSVPDQLTGSSHILKNSAEVAEPSSKLNCDATSLLITLPIKAGVLAPSTPKKTPQLHATNNLVFHLEMGWWLYYCGCGCGCGWCCGCGVQRVAPIKCKPRKRPKIGGGAGSQRLPSTSTEGRRRHTHAHTLAYRNHILAFTSEKVAELPSFLLVWYGSGVPRTVSGVPRTDGPPSPPPSPP